MKHIEEWLIIIVIFLFTFPAYYVDYGTGLDSSYVWGLNWLFVNDYETLKQLIYPFGPLAFLKIPTVIGHNLLISIIFNSILTLGFIWLMLRLSQIMGHTSKWAAVFITLVVSFFANIDFLIIGSCLILNLIYYKRRNIFLFIISVLLAFIGLFIKVSIGISSFSIIGVSIIICFLLSRDVLQGIKQLGIIVFLGLVAGIIVFGNFGTYFQFLSGVFRLSGGYGESLSLYPDNDWLILFLFILLMIIFPFINKEKDVRITYLLFLFPLFAMWKHSFIREDICHYSILLTFLFVFWGIIFLVSSSKKTFTFLTASITILLLYANMRNIPIYEGIKREVAGINNVLDVLDYKSFEQEIKSISEQNVSKNRLTPEWQAIIGNATTDIYPWDFSYIAANQFKWKPRKTLGMQMFPQNDKSAEASDYALNPSSPDFVIFHIENDHSGGKFGSIDNKYILNDEPLVMYNLLNSYTLLEKTDQLLLFKRDTISHFENIYLDEIQNFMFGDWIDIPYQGNEIIRAKVFSKNTLLGKINKILYKEPEYFVDYQFEDGVVKTYRYIHSTAVDGLWCNPFIQFPNTDFIEPRVVKIRLRNSNSFCVKESLKIQFQHILPRSALCDTIDINNLLFHKSMHSQKEVFLDMFQQFDDEQLNYDNCNITNEFAHSGTSSNKIESDGYSYTYEIHLDSLYRLAESDSLIVEANVYSINRYSNTGLVITAEGTEDDFWEVVYLPNNVSKEFWNYSYLSKLINRNNHESGVLKVYVFNFGDSPVYIDDFRLRIKNGHR